MQVLLIVDLQNDFMAQGSLAVPGAESIVPIINALIPKFSCVIASKDWHPKDHVSFISKWPPHCIEGTFGADFYKGLNQKEIKKVFYKGTKKKFDSYSAFFEDDQCTSTGLKEFLIDNNVTKIVIVGLLLEYCVAATALDGIKLGFEVTIIKEGVASLLPMKEQEILLNSLKNQNIDIISFNKLIIE